MNIYRFDLAGLTSDEVKDLKARLEAVEFMLTDDPMGRFIDLYTEKDVNLTQLLEGFKEIKYISYSGIPHELWTYPFT